MVKAPQLITTIRKRGLFLSLKHSDPPDLSGGCRRKARKKKKKKKKKRCVISAVVVIRSSGRGTSLRADGLIQCLPVWCDKAGPVPSQGLRRVHGVMQPVYSRRARARHSEIQGGGHQWTLWCFSKHFLQQQQQQQQQKNLIVEIICRFFFETVKKLPPRYTQRGESEDPEA